MKHLAGRRLSNITPLIRGRIEDTGMQRKAVGGVSLNDGSISPDVARQYEEFYKLHPEARVEIGSPADYVGGDNALYTTTSMQENLLNRFYPSNLRAAYGSYIGADAPYAQWDFLPEDLQAMSQRFEKGRSNYVGGFVPRQTGFTNDWGHVPHDRFVPYEEYTQATHAVPSVQSLPSIGNVLQSYVDPNIRIDPFVQIGRAHV